MYIDLEKEYPNGVQKNEDEILDLILNMNYKNECEKTRAFKSKYIEAGGNATALAIKNLFTDQTFPELQKPQSKRYLLFRFF